MDKIFKTCFKQEDNDLEKSVVVAWANKSDSIDRSKELIDDDAWDLTNFLKNPVIPAFHLYNRPPIGKALWCKCVKGQGLKFKVQFAQTLEGQEFYQLVKDGILNAFSVGFMPKKIKDREDFTKKDIEKYTINGELPDRVYMEVELLEISLVVVPDHMNALVERDSNGLIKTKGVKDFIEVVKDMPEYIEMRGDNHETEEMQAEEEVKTSEIITKPETTENYHRIPVPEEEGKHIDHTIRTIDITDGIKSLYCVDDKVVITYLFDVDKYTMEEAQKWVADHSKDIDLTSITEKQIQKHLALLYADKTKFFNTNGEFLFKKKENIPQNLLDIIKEIKTDMNGDIYEISFYNSNDCLEDIIKYLDIKGEEDGEKETDKEKQSQETRQTSKTAEEEKEIVTLLEAIDKELGYFDDKEELDLIIKEVLQEEQDEQIPIDIKQETERVSKFLNSLRVKNISETKKKELKEQYGEDFDITQVRTEPATFEYKIFTKYLGCKIKDIFVTDFYIPSVMMGNYLSAFRNVLAKHVLVDQRNFYRDKEIPLRHSVVQLNSKRSEEFLIDGTQFYKTNNKESFVLQIYPSWGGLEVNIYTSNKNIELNKSFSEDVVKWVEENNLLRGEKFSIEGEFLPIKEIGWDDVVYPNEELKSKIKKNIERLSKNSGSRGIMLIGEPGVGKTLTGKVLMKESDATFIWASSKDFEWGATRGISMGFELARKLAPSIFFMEDIDTWLGGYTIDLLKTEMDGIRENKGVLTILTSNFPENIPDALIDRPGRFHHILNFPLPDKDNRVKLLKIFIKDADKNIIDKFANETEGYSGSHIKELVDFAKMIMEDENISIELALGKSLAQMQEQKQLIADIKEGNRKKSVEDLQISISVGDEDFNAHLDQKANDLIELVAEKSTEEIDLNPDEIKEVIFKSIKETFTSPEDISQLVDERIKRYKGIIF